MKNKSNYALSRKLSLSSPLDVLHWEAACLSQSRQQINYFDTTLVTNTHIYAHKTQFQGFLCVYTQTNKLLIGSERVWCIPRITLFEAENRIFFFFFYSRRSKENVCDFRLSFRNTKVFHLYWWNVAGCAISWITFRFHRKWKGINREIKPNQGDVKNAISEGGLCFQWRKED